MKNFVREKRSPIIGRKAGSLLPIGNLPKTIEIVRERPFPPSIPVIDLVSESPPFSSDKDISRWRNCYRQFVNAQANRQGITAYGSGHYIDKDNPPLVIDSVVKAYIGIMDRQNAFDIARREVDYAIEAANRGGQRAGASRR